MTDPPEDLAAPAPTAITPRGILPSGRQVVLALLSSIPAALLIFGVDHYVKPKPSLVADGTKVNYVVEPEHEQLGPITINTVRTYWQVTVRNTGTQEAAKVRLHLPEITTARIGQKLIRATPVPTFPTLARLGFMDIGTLQPGEAISVEGWSSGGIALMSSGEPAITHSNGYGTITIREVERDFRDESPVYFAFLKTAITLTALATLLLLVGERLRKRSA